MVGLRGAEIGLGAEGAPRKRRELKTPNPVSIRLEQLQRLADRGDLRYEYVVSEKSDGVRFWLFPFRHPDHGRACAVWINRALEMFGVPLEGEPALWDGDGTLIDGELLEDQTPPLYLAYDLYVDGGTNLLPQSFSNRWLRLRTLFSGADASQQPAPLLRSLSPSSVRLECKRFFSLDAVPRLLTEWIPRLPYRTDGLVFVPLHRTPVFGRRLLLEVEGAAQRRLSGALAGRSALVSGPLWSAAAAAARQQSFLARSNALSGAAGFLRGAKRTARALFRTNRRGALVAAERLVCCARSYAHSRSRSRSYSRFYKHGHY